MDIRFGEYGVSHSLYIWAHSGIPFFGKMQSSVSLSAIKNSANCFAACIALALGGFRGIALSLRVIEMKLSIISFEGARSFGWSSTFFRVSVRTQENTFLRLRSDSKLK